MKFNYWKESYCVRCDTFKKLLKFHTFYNKKFPVLLRGIFFISFLTVMFVFYL